MSLSRRMTSRRTSNASVPTATVAIADSRSRPSCVAPSSYVEENERLASAAARSTFASSTRRTSAWRTPRVLQPSRRGLEPPGLARTPGARPRLDGSFDGGSRSCRRPAVRDFRHRKEAGPATVRPTHRATSREDHQRLASDASAVTATSSTQEQRIDVPVAQDDVAPNVECVRAARDRRHRKEAGAGGRASTHRAM